MKCNAWFELLKHLVLTKLPAFVSLPYSSPGRLTEQKDSRKTNKRPGKSIYIRDQLIVNVLSTLVIECACCPSWEHTGSHELTPRINNCLLSSLKRVDLFCVRAGKHLFSAFTLHWCSHMYKFAKHFNMHACREEEEACRLDQRQPLWIVKLLLCLGLTAYIFKILLTHVLTPLGNTSQTVMLIFPN